MHWRNVASLYSGRILAHGQITDLGEGFSLPDKTMFSIFVAPKAATDASFIIVSCKSLQNTQSANTPVLLNDWTPHGLKELPANCIDLDDYDVYWGAGHNYKLEVI